MDSNSDMGLTTREKQSQITINQGPKYFQVLTEEGDKRCQCGSEYDAQMMCKLNPGFTYTVHYLPPPPKTVNVSHVRLEDDKQFPEQNILPKSELEELKL